MQCLHVGRAAHREGLAGEVCLAIQDCIQKASLRVLLLMHFHALLPGHSVL